jgi:hypothetical protein
VSSSTYLERYYFDLMDRRGAGRARVALIRKLCGMMRRMLLSSERYRWIDQRLFDKKISKYERVLNRVKKERPAA